MRWAVDVIQRGCENNFSVAYGGKVGSCMDGRTGTAWGSRAGRKSAKMGADET